MLQLAGSYKVVYCAGDVRVMLNVSFLTLAQITVVSIRTLNHYELLEWAKSTLRAPDLVSRYHAKMFT